MSLFLTDDKNAMLAAIIANSDDAIVSKTLNGTIISWNPAAERIFGYSEAEAIGQHISLIIPPDRLSEEDFIIGQIRAGTKVDHFQTVRRTKAGKEVHISVTVSPVTGENNEIIGASKIARDISEQVALQAERARLFDEVKALNDRKDEFIGLASHELKTPLTSLTGYLQLLERECGTGKSLHLITKAAQQVKKLGSLVDDLLDVTRITTGNLPLHIKTFNIRMLVEDAIELVALAQPAYQLELVTSVTSLELRGDPQRIEQVLVNLLTNAARYSPDHKRIIVGLQADAESITVSVLDRGLGIAPEKLERIFSRFYRVEEHAGHAAGLGLGLYLSQEIIERHQGRLWAESEPGRGSTFYFTLPLVT